MKYVYLLFVFLLLDHAPMIAQSNPDGVDAIYKIKLIALRDSFELDKFDDVRDLGTIIYEKTETGFTRVFLGYYISKNTALEIQEQVKERGYSKCYLVRQDSAFINKEGEPLTHTLQFTATKSLDVERILKRLNNANQMEIRPEDLYIWYSNGYFRLTLGCFAKSDFRTKERYTTTLIMAGYTKSFLKKLKPLPKIYTRERLSFDSKPVVEPEIAPQKNENKATNSKLSSRPKTSPNTIGHPIVPTFEKN